VPAFPLPFTLLKGKPVSHLGYKIVPISRAMQIQIPHITGGVIWNRPVSVLVEYPDNREQMLTVPDITRRMQILCLVAGFLGSIFIAAIYHFFKKTT